MLLGVPLGLRFIFTCTSPGSARDRCKVTALYPACHPGFEPQPLCQTGVCTKTPDQGVSAYRTRLERLTCQQGGQNLSRLVRWQLHLTHRNFGLAVGNAALSG